MEIFMIWLVLALVMGAVGSTRKIGFWGAFLLSLILSPLIGGIITLVSAQETSTAPLSFGGQPLAVPPAEPEALTVNTLDEQLRKLTAMKKDGLITEDEFDQLRKKLLP